MGRNGNKFHLDAQERSSDLKAINMKTVLVFGTFDGLHPGHDDFFDQVKELGDNIVVCLTQDKVVRELKGKDPIEPFEQRKEALKKQSQISQIIPGDLDIGAFRAISIVQPDIIAIGYDQDELEKAITVWLDKYNGDIPVIQLRPFKPDTYKSSLLRK